MKKLSLTVFTVICALCMAFGVSLMANTNKANAETVDGVTPVLSATKYKISTSKNGMLIATGIKNCEDVYEVGYTFSGDVTAVNNSTTKYYTSIISGTNEWTVEELFEGYTGMIVWEIEYNPAVEYSYKAYAKVGDRVDGNLVETDKKVEGTTKAVDIEQFTITFEMGDGEAISPISVDYGTPVSELNNVVVTAPEHYHFVKWQLKTGESTYVDFVGNETLTEDITVKAVYAIDTFTVRFLNYDGTVLQSGSVDYGATPVYSGATPTKATDENYSYTFNTWDPAIAAVSANADYTATFNSQELSILSIESYAENILIFTEIDIPDASIVGKVSGDFVTSDGITVSATLNGDPVDVSGGTYQPLNTGSLVITYSADGVADAVATITVVNSETLVTKNDLISKTSYVYYYGNSYYLGNPPSAQYAGEKSYCIQLNCPSEPASYLIFEINVGDVSKYDHLEMKFWALHSDGGTWNVKAGNSDGTTLFTGTGWRGYDNPVTIDVATSYVNNGKLRLTLYQNYYNTCELYIQYIKGVAPAEYVTPEQQAFELLSTASSYGSQHPDFGHGNFGGVTTSGDSIIVTANVGGDGVGRGFTIKQATVKALYDLGFGSMSFTVSIPSGYVCLYCDNTTSDANLNGGAPFGGDGIHSGNHTFYASGDTVTINIKLLAESSSFMAGNFGVYFVLKNTATWGDYYSSNGTITFSDLAFTPV